MKKDGIEKSDLLNQSINKAYNKSIPFITTLEITQHCNLKCLHCYNFDRSKKMPSSIKENSLKPADIIAVIDELGDMGCMYLNISGGEALLHPHLDEFIKRARTHKMEVRLKSNAIMLTEKRLTELKDVGLKGIDISLYGSSEESYFAFTKLKDGFAKTISGMKATLQSKVPTNINIILHRNNVSELSEMISLCESQDFPFQISTEVTERYDGSQGAREHEITLEQFETLLLGEHGKFFMANNPEKNLQCSCARSVCGINSLGDVFPCIGAPIKAGNIKEDKLQDIWQNSPILSKIRNLKKEDFKECMSCDYIEFCDRSSGSCYVNSGNFTGCDPSLISQAKIRKKHAKTFVLA